LPALRGDLRPPGRPSSAIRSPTTNTPGARQRTVGRHLHAARAVDGGLCAVGEQPPERRGLHARRPDLGAGLDAAALDVQPGRVDADDPSAEAQLDPSASRSRRARRRSRAGSWATRCPRRRAARSARCRVEAAEVGAQRSTGELGDLPGKLHAGRTGTDDRERQPRFAGGIVGLQLGHLEGAEDPPAELERVVDRLQPRRVAGVLVVPEVGLRRAGCQDEAVVGQRRRLSQGVDRQRPPGGVDVDDLTEQDTRVAVVAQHVADRRGDVAFGEHARGDLVEQRLEEVVVGAVDDHHLDLGAAQGVGGEEPGEAAADDDHAVHDSPLARVRDPPQRRQRRHEEVFAAAEAR
jgi:hypothetical protein